jgi:hypothetical protein
MVRELLSEPRGFTKLRILHPPRRSRLVLNPETGRLVLYTYSAEGSRGPFLGYARLEG